MDPDRSEEQITRATPASIYLTSSLSAKKTEPSVPASSITRHQDLISPSTAVIPPIHISPHQEDFERLKASNSKLWDDNIELQSRLDNLSTQNSELAVECSKLKCQNRHLMSQKDNFTGLREHCYLLPEERKQLGYEVLGDKSLLDYHTQQTMTKLGVFQERHVALETSNAEQKPAMKSSASASLRGLKKRLGSLSEEYTSKVRRIGGGKERLIKVDYRKDSVASLERIGRRRPPEG